MSEQGNNPEETNSVAGGEAEAKFALQRIYVKDASFESPRAPACFKEQWQPKINLELNSRFEPIEADLYEVVLHITITARNDKEEIVFLVEVQQAGIFLIQGLEDEPKHKTLGSFCPSVLFPYAREAVDALVLKGSFPALLLAPVNFDAIYEHARAQRLQQQQQQQQQ